MIMLVIYMNMLQYTYNKKRKVHTRNKNIIIKNDDDSDTTDDDNDDYANKTILKEHNHIYFHSEVNRDAIFELITHIRKAEIENIVLAHKLNSDNPIPIFLHINSFGGSVFDAFTAIDVIISCSIPIYTIIEGATASAGTLISIMGKKKYIRPNDLLLFATI